MPPAESKSTESDYVGIVILQNFIVFNVLLGDFEV